MDPSNQHSRNTAERAPCKRGARRRGVRRVSRSGSNPRVANSASLRDARSVRVLEPRPREAENPDLRGFVAGIIDWSELARQVNARPGIGQEEHVAEHRW